MQTDPIFKAIGGALASCHPISSAIFTGFNTYRNEIEMRFVKDVIVGINERIQRLEQRLDKDYMQSDDYKNFLYKTLRMATNDVRQEKLRLFANIIVNAALEDRADEKDGRKYLYDETIEKLDEELFVFLLRMSTRVLDGFDMEAKGWSGIDEELEVLGVDVNTFHFNAEYLLSVGVVVRLPRFDFSAETGVLSYHEEYYVTRYGYDFVEYVKDC